ncbi:hypothetical protein BJ508DRAFT_335130 [Ascobolus immersus RN42]|uniref:Uncharacterized protein n=1 Tax=Ascobolus immersus RN42 TaxID=1160509 RepID=A0A3N4HKB5_ASCIM|nr:hypothetical protein BJ508DRAFT_335130 [Ascobolus immersus RN42]
MPALYLNQTLTTLTTFATTTTHCAHSTGTPALAALSSIIPTISATATVVAAAVSGGKEAFSTESVVAIALGVPTLVITGVGVMYKRLGAASQKRIEEAVNSSDLEAGDCDIVEAVKDAGDVGVAYVEVPEVEV